MAAAAWTAAGKASALWLVGYFAIATIGELHLAPVGLALVSKMAPARMLSMMMGFWFAATLPGDILAGFLGGFWSTHGQAGFLLDDRVDRGAGKRRHLGHEPRHREPTSCGPRSDVMRTF